MLFCIVIDTKYGLFAKVSCALATDSSKEFVVEKQKEEFLPLIERGCW